MADTTSTQSTTSQGNLGTFSAGSSQGAANSSSSSTAVKVSVGKEVKNPLENVLASQRKQIEDLRTQIEGINKQRIDEVKQALKQAELKIDKESENKEKILELGKLQYSENKKLISTLKAERQSFLNFKTEQALILSQKEEELSRANEEIRSREIEMEAIVNAPSSGSVPGARNQSIMSTMLAEEVSAYQRYMYVLEYFDKTLDGALEALDNASGNISAASVEKNMDALEKELIEEEELLEPLLTEKQDEEAEQRPDVAPTILVEAVMPVFLEKTNDPLAELNLDNDLGEITAQGEGVSQSTNTVTTTEVTAPTEINISPLSDQSAADIDIIVDHYSKKASLLDYFTSPFGIPAPEVSKQSKEQKTTSLYGEKVAQTISELRESEGKAVPLPLVSSLIDSPLFAYADSVWDKIKEQTLQFIYFDTEGQSFSFLHMNDTLGAPVSIQKEVSVFVKNLIEVKAALEARPLELLKDEISTLTLSDFYETVRRQGETAQEEGLTKNPLDEATELLGISSFGETEKNELLLSAGKLIQKHFLQTIAQNSLTDDKVKALKISAIMGPAFYTTTLLHTLDHTGNPIDYDAIFIQVKKEGLHT